MTSKSTRKVVIINDLKSANIEQAIFILRDVETTECKKSILDEANEIVQNYVRQVSAGHYRSVAPKKKWFRKDK